jgi:flagellar biosynthesis/type III secretory pathway protein FliH
MSGTFTINLDKSVTSATLVTPGSGSRSCNASSELSSDADTTQSGLMQDIEKQKAEIAQLCQTLKALANQLNRFYDELLAMQKGEIARLSVEIARKILMQKVQKEDYKIESIVEAALENAPTHQDVVVRLHPEDLAQLQRLQSSDTARSHQAGSGGLFPGIEFVPDASIGRAECLVETPKGVIKSLVDEHIQRISEALEKVK